MNIQNQRAHSCFLHVVLAKMVRSGQNVRYSMAYPGIDLGDHNRGTPICPCLRKQPTLTAYMRKSVWGPPPLFHWDQVVGSLLSLGPWQRTWRQHKFSLAKGKAHIPGGFRFCGSKKCPDVPNYFLGRPFSCTLNSFYLESP